MIIKGNETEIGRIGSNDTDDFSDISNAYLIAAAPEMFQLLDVLCIELEDNVELFTKIKKVLAKAGGES